MIINWTEPALDNLDAIHAFYQHDAPVYAEHLMEHLFSAVERLEAFPESGRRVPEAQYASIDIREVITKGYRILYYLVDAERIDILGVRSERQDLSRPDNQPWQPH